VLHQGAGLNVERGKGLIHQQDSRAIDQALGQADPLPHASRQLMRVAVLETREAHTGDPVPGPGTRLGRGHPMVAGSGGNVFQNGLPRKDRVALEDVANAVGDAPDRAALDPDLACARQLQAGDERQGRRLSATGRTDHSTELTWPDLECEIAQCRIDAALGGSEPLSDTTQLDRRAGHSRNRKWASRPLKRLAEFATVLVVVVAACDRETGYDEIGAPTSP